MRAFMHLCHRIVLQLPVTTTSTSAGLRVQAHSLRMDFHRVTVSFKFITSHCTHIMH